MYSPHNSPAIKKINKNLTAIKWRFIALSTYFSKNRMNHVSGYSFVENMNKPNKKPVDHFCELLQDISVQIMKRHHQAMTSPTAEHQLFSLGPVTPQQWSKMKFINIFNSTKAFIEVKHLRCLPSVCVACPMPFVL